jgi:hypothetical protein
MAVSYMHRQSSRHVAVFLWEYRTYEMHIEVKTLLRKMIGL